MSRLFALSFVILAAFSIAAHAQSNYGKPVTVTYKDLDLNTDAGAQVLLARIERAASVACGGDPWWQWPFTDVSVVMHLYKKCRADAISAAVQSVNRPRLTQAYAATQVQAADGLALH